jgi:hypothetical protein
MIGDALIVMPTFKAGCFGACCHQFLEGTDQLAATEQCWHIICNSNTLDTCLQDAWLCCTHQLPGLRASRSVLYHIRVHEGGALGFSVDAAGQGSAE